MGDVVVGDVVLVVAVVVDEGVAVELDPELLLLRNAEPPPQPKSQTVAAKTSTSFPAEPVLNDNMRSQVGEPDLARLRTQRDYYD